MNAVKIIRSSKRKTVNIKILQDSTVQVTIPFFLPRFYVTRLLQEKKDWIEEAQQKMLARKKTASAEGSYLYLGKQYELVERPGQNEMIEIADKLYIGSANKKFVKTYLESWYKQQARKIIVERVHLYAKRAELSFRSVAITTAETRWGSCSSNRTLNFNWKLVMAPIEVIDYVVSHELAHLTEMNHSRAFWDTVRKMYPLYREYRTWLRRNGERLTV